MLFNSFEFLLLFFPIVFIGYFIIGEYTNSRSLSTLWLFVSSLIFYGWSNKFYIILILSSIAVNYTISLFIKKDTNWKKVTLILGIVFNVALLSYYKYYDFFIENINLALRSDFNLLHLVLPIGISFFTFQQIAFLVDVYQGRIGKYDFLSYGMFISFFPQLIAGPIVHHKEMMPQFQDKKVRKINWFNVSKGLFVFNMGLAKKLIIADTLGKIASFGYANTSLLDFNEGWITSLAYSLQLYFDFSGYSDMAIGLGLMFNIVLPINFSSPYKAESIKVFWRRWHMTLSAFLRDYIYIPLGGNRMGLFKTRLNLMITFIIGGIWHGAGWTFIFWGFLHGGALVIHSIFEKLRVNFPKALAVVLTFFFVNVTWVFFRANSWVDAINVLESMSGLQEGSPSFYLVMSYLDFPIWLAAFILLFTRNTNEIAANFKLNRKYQWQIIILIVLNILFLNSTISQEFLYFDF